MFFSIKFQAGKPNLAGPRLCAVRIPSDSGSVLIDNIGADSTPIMYTRRNRLLDEELNEKNIITTQESTANSCTERTFHRISMLMSDGVISAPINESNIFKADQYDAQQCNTNNDTSNEQLIDIAESPSELNQIEMMTTATHNVNGSSEILTKLDAFHPNEMALDSNLKIENQNSSIEISQKPNTKSELIGIVDQKQYPFIHMHQIRQQSLAVDESILLKRQQLNRVAEWVKSNSDHEANRTCHTNIDKTFSKINNNCSEINVHSVDRNSKTLAMLKNCKSNISINNSSTGSSINNNESVNNCSNQHHEFDTNSFNDMNYSQMEYNVKQFLLRPCRYDN